MARERAQGRETTRTAWPVTVGYLETVRHLIAWCELRQDFRSFRTDRVTAAGLLDERYPEAAECPADEMAADPEPDKNSEHLANQVRHLVPAPVPLARGSGCSPPARTISGCWYRCGE